MVISLTFLLQMTLTVTELKENLRKTDEDAKSKDVKITSLEKDVSNKDSELKKVRIDKSVLNSDNNELQIQIHDIVKFTFVGEYLCRRTQRKHAKGRRGNEVEG